MLKIIPGSQIKTLDEAYVSDRKISSFDLMENAAEAFCAWFSGRFNPNISIAVFCGMGNNGGDGLAISRLLVSRGYEVEIFFLGDTARASVDFKKNYTLMPNKIPVQEVDWTRLAHLNKDVVIDALFGAGINRPVEGDHLKLIHFLNKVKAIKIAVDVPSGIPTDSVLQGEALMADHCVSFQFPKLSLLFPEHGRYIGELHVLDIGIGEAYFEKFPSRNFFITERDIHEMHLKFSRFSHKGNFGKVMLIGGSYGKMGAIALSGRAALRTGSGLVSCYLPKCGVDILQTAVPEIMVESSTGELELKVSGLENLDRFDALGVGPGMGTSENARDCLQYILNTYQKPLVLDADAINLIAANRHLIALLRQNMLITPHLKEFERLVGPCRDHLERMEKAQSFCKTHGCVLILKGAHTLISLPNGDQLFNSTGSQYMATGGAGDVLTGMLTSLLGQGYAAENASVCGVFHHGLAGERASTNRLRGTIASDILDGIPASFVKLGIP